MEQVDASSVFAEEEVEYVLCEVVNGVKETLARISFAERRARVVVWNTPFYDIGVLLFTIKTFIYTDLYWSPLCNFLMFISSM